MKALQEISDASAPKSSLDVDLSGESLIGSKEITLNPGGAVTGFFVDSVGVEHGFVRRKDGSFIGFDEVPEPMRKDFAEKLPPTYRFLRGDGSFVVSYKKGRVAAKNQTSHLSASSPLRHPYPAGDRRAVETCGGKSGVRGREF